MRCHQELTQTLEGSQTITEIAHRLSGQRLSFRVEEYRGNFRQQLYITQTVIQTQFQAWKLQIQHG
jgi:hypothetical protein